MLGKLDFVRLGLLQLLLHHFDSLVLCLLVNTSFKRANIVKVFKICSLKLSWFGPAAVVAEIDFTGLIFHASWAFPNRQEVFLVLSFVQVVENSIIMSYFRLLNIGH